MPVDFQTAVSQEEEYLRKLHPTVDDIPGCVSLLDGFFMCHVLNAQFKSLYRYGRMSECGDKLEAFKFCLSLKSMHPEQKRDAWIRRRAEGLAAKRLGKSSENWTTAKLASRSPKRRGAEYRKHPLNTSRL
ncbi:hypothetical protein PISMIDRAFT_675389, partial [Pisolithus microcarpus 441]